MKLLKRHPILLDYCLVGALIFIYFYFSINTCYAEGYTENYILDGSEVPYITPEQITILQANIKDVIVGSVLGDGCLVDPKVGTVYFRFKQSVVHVAYFFFIYRVFEPWCTKGSPINQSFFDKRYNTTYHSMVLLTRAIYSEVLNLQYYRDLFYVNSIKVILVNIADHLTPIALAIWIQDDGHYDNGGIYQMMDDGYNITVQHCLCKNCA